MNSCAWPKSSSDRLERMRMEQLRDEVEVYKLELERLRHERADLRNKLECMTEVVLTMCRIAGGEK